jgi:nuclear factor of activated T-cells 5
MPRTENQKVATAYLSQQLYDQLVDFKSQEGLKSISQALTAIVEQFFAHSDRLPVDTGLNSDHVVEERLEQLEKKIACMEFFWKDERDHILGIIDNLLKRTDFLIPSTLSSNVPGTLESTSDNDVPGTLESTLDSNVPGTLESTSDNDVPSTLDSTLDSNVPSTLESTLDSNVPSTLESTLDSNVPGTIESTLDSNVRNDFRSEPRDEKNDQFVIGLLSQIDGQIEVTGYWLNPKKGFVSDVRQAKLYNGEANTKRAFTILSKRLQLNEGDRISYKLLSELEQLAL